ncbi:endonuclease VII [Arthrobacter phage Yang]|uniref:Uncharacterized protein n=1 Tax=Arthrobacter phage Yang TaxID=2419970 RepID=A0A3G2KJH2_9CAUD|nr:endonuclease VII [Arthrobacter phage Yang]AYN59151.1 hypothetical protein PBI_YANG_66 [Arthrobacter phage Yang]
MVEEVTPAARIAQAAQAFDSGNGEAQALTAQALARLAYRRRHSGKTCQTCRETKPLSAFGFDALRPDGLSVRCRACNSARMRASRAARVNVPQPGQPSLM